MLNDKRKVQINESGLNLVDGDYKGIFWELFISYECVWPFQA